MQASEDMECGTQALWTWFWNLTEMNSAQRYYFYVPFWKQKYMDLE